MKVYFIDGAALIQLNIISSLKIHWPVRLKKGSTGFSPENFVTPDIPSTWRAMEALFDSGKARAIGVSNFSTKKLADLLEVARVPPAVNQVECHPSWQQDKLHEFCKSKGVHLTVSSKILTDFPLAVPYPIHTNCCHITSSWLRNMVCSFKLYNS